MLKRLLAATATIASLSLLASCGNEGDTTAADPGTSDSTAADPGTSDSTGAPTTSVTCKYDKDGTEPAKPVDPPPSEATVSGQIPVTFQTSLGDISATLDADATPCTVNSFISLAKQGFFDETPCPRIATSPDFGILQCGDPTGTGSGGPGYSFADELTGNETYTAGTLAMANAGPNTNGSQFFFVFNDSPSLPPSYNLFGSVDEAGLKLLTDAAKAGDDGSNPAGGGAPNSGPISITGVTLD